MEFDEFPFDAEEHSLTAGLETGAPSRGDDPSGDVAEGVRMRAMLEQMRQGGNVQGVGSTTMVPCVHCAAGVSGNFFEAFGIAACQPCRETMTTQYKLVTRAYCKAELLLSDKQLDSLRSLRVPNPHKKSFNPMRLYLRSQAEQVARTTWGAESDIEAERRRREDVRLGKANAKAKRSMPLLPVAASRGQPSSGAPLAPASSGGLGEAEVAKRSRLDNEPSRKLAEAHEHQYEPEVLVDAEKDLYSRRCAICKCVSTYEKL